MVTKFKVKNVPKGFSYPFTKKDLKLGILNFGDMFRSVEFDGISSSDKHDYGTKRYWVGIVTVSRIEGRWIFDIEIEALRNDKIRPMKESIKKIILKDISNWVDKKSLLLETSPVEPRQLFLAFTNTGGSIISSSHEVRKDR